MTSTAHAVAMVAIAATVTMAIRFLPFVVLAGRPTPKFISYLGRFLPYSVMAMLVVYCLKDMTPLSGNHALPELLAVAATALLHIWRRNTLLSIACGTVCYMLLIQFVFV